MKAKQMPKTAVPTACAKTASCSCQTRWYFLESPGCGPAAVATVPVTSRTRQPAAAATAASRSSRGTGDGTLPRSVPSAATTTTTAAPSTTADRRKCDITRYGLRSKRTVRAPSGACASVPAKTPTAVQRAHEEARDAERVRARRRASSTISFLPHGSNPEEGGLLRPPPAPPAASETTPSSRTVAPVMTMSQSAVAEVSASVQRRPRASWRPASRPLRGRGPGYPSAPSKGVGRE